MFVIRDGLAPDIAACLALDHTYETDYVWQVVLHQDSQQQTVAFKTERLPRAMQVTYPASEQRLRLALPAGNAFLVALEDDDIVGYLTLRPDPIHAIALVQDIVVAPSYRRQNIGTRLLNVARKWAMEKRLKQLTIETQTKNYPAILFCQKAGLTFCGFNDHYFQNQDIAVFFSQSLRH